MPSADRERANAEWRDYYHANLEYQRARNRAKYAKHREKRKASQRAYNAANAEAIKIRRRVRYLASDHMKNQSKEWARAHPEMTKHLNRRTRRRREHGVPIEAAEAQLRIQSGRCAICPREISFEIPRGKTAAVTDHCHVSGRFRGVLCSLCNVALGGFGDSLDTLESAVLYLKSSL
jgi:hypothetical protein